MTATLTHRREIRPYQALGIIRREAQRQQRPVPEVLTVAKLKGLGTPEGRVFKAGCWFVETQVCKCVRNGIPDVTCRSCRGRGVIG
ncbi:hypothetical protein GCM10022631_10560 [Deinococcus rubellus]|uniref:hypothetical protein n=1 Tax=Deinococcus rubellus TaxID=1889240 RepID=UPI0031EB51AF